jgi:hypothetical protein
VRSVCAARWRELRAARTRSGESGCDQHRKGSAGACSQHPRNA